MGTRASESPWLVAVLVNVIVVAFIVTRQFSVFL